MSLGPSGSDILDHNEPEWQPIEGARDIPPGRYMLHNEQVPWTAQAERIGGEFVNKHGHRMNGMTHFKRVEERP